MWIKLISPRMSQRPMDTALKTQMAPSLALLVLAALTPERHRLTLADENVERITTQDRPDLVGITVKVDTAYRAYDLARLYRARGVPVVLGGIHPTACPEEALAQADAVAIGEAEELWPGIVADAEQHRLKRLYRQSAASDLARVPVPRLDLVRSKPYLFTNTLVAGRGCPWRCDFCYSSSPNLPRGHRMKPIANILAEIEALGARHVFFIDDNFIGTPAAARELLTALQPLGLTWHTAVSADIGQREDLLDLMAAAGCQSLFIGFETLNKESLSRVHKRQNRVEEYNETIAKIHRRGMMVNASVVFGFDADGPEVFALTVDWLVRQKVETMTGHILTPFPGTVFYDRLLREGRIFDHDFRHYNTSRAVFRPKNLTPEELEAGFCRSYREFYSLANIWARLPEPGPRLVPYLLFNLGYRKCGPIFSALGKLGIMGHLGRLGRALSYPRTVGGSTQSERRQRSEDFPSPVSVVRPCA